MGVYSVCVGVCGVYECVKYSNELSPQCIARAEEVLKLQVMWSDKENTPFVQSYS